MLSRNTAILLLVGLSLLDSCCKSPIDINSRNIFEQITERNQLPRTLPTISNVANGDQTKEIFFYNPSNIDLVFRSMGMKDSTTSNTRLWVQILNPDIQIFADTQLDTIYKDIVYEGTVPIKERHNRDDGINFHSLDTSLLALSFAPSQFDTWRPRLIDDAFLTIHIKFYDRFFSDSTGYDIERGALQRKTQDYIGFKNIVSGDVFFIELEDRYTLKSIEVRKD